jgi:TonB-linked SusC/RagA family outer membrane protein
MLIDMSPKLLLRIIGKGLLLSACCMHQPASAKSQFAYNDVRPGRHVTSPYQETNPTLGTLLSTLEKKYNVSFLCRSELLDIKIFLGKTTFEENQFIGKLQKLLRAYSLKVKQITPQQYAITKTNNKPVTEKAEEKKEAPEDKPTPAALLQGTTIINNSTITVNAREIPITGVVTALANGNPLPGVSIAVKGTDKATITDEDGKFSIQVPDKNTVLVFSFVGYATREIKVDNQPVLNVVLSEATKNMDEVVVVGFGTQKKVHLTGAVEAVTGKDLANRSVPNVSGALQGMMPGLTITTTNARPGAAGTTIRIRGIGTIGNSNPLVIIDGIEQSMDLLNPDDIESVSVLKDAASAAMYGSRAANGVVLITTRKGKTGAKPTVSYSYYYGSQRPTALPEFLGSPEFMELTNEAQINTGRTPTYTAAEIQKALDGSDPNYYANTNWIKALYKPSAPQQQHNVSVNGGNNKSGYYLSYGFLDQDGIVRGDAYKAKRHNARLRLNTEIADRVQLDANISYVDRFDSQPAQETNYDGGLIYSAHTISPLVPVRFTNGEWGYGGGSQNPVAIAADGGLEKFASQQASININGVVSIIKGLSAKLQYGLVVDNSKRVEQVRTVQYFFPDNGNLWYTSNPTNSIGHSDYAIRYQNVLAQLDYAVQLGKHDIKWLGGYSNEWKQHHEFITGRQNMTTSDLESIVIGTENPTNNGKDYDWAISSLFSRLNYVYNEKYLLEASIRYDGSSRFAPTNRWGVFPSVSAGWRFSEEKFMDRFRGVLSNGKVRASWGKLGNQYVGDQNLSTSYYPYLSVLQSVSTMPIGGVLTSAFAQTISANPDLRWESVEMSNIGLDLSFLNDRLTISGDYFVKKTNDILLTIPLPDVLGVTEPPQNAGSVENRGWEFSAGWNDNIGELKYGFRANISDVRNKVTDLAGVPPTIGDQVHMVGYPINAFYGLVAERIAQVADFDYDPVTKKYTPKFPVLDADKTNVQPGDLIYKDLDDDKKITLDKDRQVIGNPFPRYSYSLRGNANWKGFDFAFFLQGVGKGNGYIFGSARQAFITQSTNPQKVHLDRWTPDNTGASQPRLTSQQSHNARLSTFWMENAAYLRLKNIQLGYTLPTALTSRARVQRARLYVSADNLFTATNFFYAYDPETPLTSGGTYPQIKTIIVGLNVTFR